MPVDEDIRIVIRTEAGNIVGGICGHVALYCYLLEDLWIDEQLRGKGCGQQLLKSAEEMCPFGKRAWLSSSEEVP